MTVWGIGGKWFLWTFIGSLPVIICAYLFRYSLIVTSISPWWFYSIGVLLLIGGIPFWLLSAITLKKAFDKEHLCTSGVFGVCRNPIYASWILFLVPGVLLFFLNPLLMAIPFIMYTVLRILLHKEEEWLEAKYGESYREYKQRVMRIFPRPNFSRKGNNPSGREGESI